MGQREDLRQHPRLVAPQTAELVEMEAEAGAAALPCLIEDISAGGARVLAERRLEPGLGVGLRLPGAAALPGSLVYRFERRPGGGYGYGVRFSATAQVAAAGVWQAVGTTSRLLVVHPDRAVCRQLVHELAAAGAPAAAVQAAADTVVLLDVLAPGLQAVMVEAALAESSEVDLLSLLARNHPQVGRVVLSDPMYPTLSIRRRAAPACTVWPTPWSGAHLRRRLSVLLASRSVGRPGGDWPTPRGAGA